MTDYWNGFWTGLATELNGLLMAAIARGMYEMELIGIVLAFIVVANSFYWVGKTYGKRESR